MKDPQRRERALADPEEFLRVYLGDRFNKPFTAVRRAIIEAITSRCLHGGQAALCAPRGTGKTSLVQGVLTWALLSGHVTFALLIMAREDLASTAQRSIQETFWWNPLLAEDFPAVCQCVQHVSPAPVRAKSMTVHGESTGMIWGMGDIRFPLIPGHPDAAGQCMRAAGITSSNIRGALIGGRRPDFCLLDDIDDRGSADSEQQTATRAKLIDEDIFGLGGDEGLATVMISTPLNRRSCGWLFSDRESRPGWRGQRFKLLERKPFNEPMWDQFIAMRLAGQKDGTDPDGRAAHAFYVENRAEMDAGAIVTDDHRFSTRIHADGQPLEVSTIEWIFNRIADLTSQGGDPWVSFDTEFNCEPPEESLPTDSGLSSTAIANKFSGWPQGAVPEKTKKVTMFVDVGRRQLHWAATAWQEDGTGAVVDYDTVTTGAAEGQDDAAIELAIRRSLERLFHELETERPLFDAGGEAVALPELILIDSGWMEAAVSAFVEQAGYGRFYPSRGFGSSTRYRTRSYHAPGKKAAKVGDGWWIGQREGGPGWTIGFDADQWKSYLVERWLTATGQPGALSVFGCPPAGDLAAAAMAAREHATFSFHQTSESCLEQFLPKRGVVKTWVRRSKHNHFFDCMAGCCVAASVLGIGLLQSTPSALAPTAPPKRGRSIVYRRPIRIR